MNEKQHEQTPEWFVEVLGGAHITDSFRERIKAASAAAFAMARMRSEKNKVGFVALPLGEYLRGLANLASVSLDTVLAAAGIDSGPEPTMRTANLFGKFAHSLGFELDELITHLRIGVSEEASGTPLPMLAAARSGIVPNHPRDCARMLDLIEIRWPKELRAEMATIRESATAGFRDDASIELEVIR